MDFEKLWALPGRPLVHPNGFIQLYLGERRRLHVWPDEPLKAADPLTDVHDHTFGFTSRVLFGKIRNVTFRPVPHPDGDYHLYFVKPYIVDRTEAPFERVDDQRYKMRYLALKTVSRGDSYRMEPFVFHQTVADNLTVTMVEIDEFDRTKSARVVCPMFEKPDDKFRRDAEDPGKLWAIIKKALRVPDVHNVCQECDERDQT